MIRGNSIPDGIDLFDRKDLRYKAFVKRELLTYDHNLEI